MRRQYSLESESNKYLYYVTDDGGVIKKCKSNGRETAAKAYLKNNMATVKANCKEYTLKNLVAKHYCRNYVPGAYIETKNGNPFDCAARNLRVYTKSEHGRRTGYKSKSRPITINGKRYRSVRQAAKTLPCSYQTIYDLGNCEMTEEIWRARTKGAAAHIELQSPGKMQEQARKSHSLTSLGKPQQGKGIKRTMQPTASYFAKTHSIGFYQQGQQ
jgi:hypothetical protein